MTAHTPPEVVVTAALHAAGLPVTGTELEGMVARYPKLRAAVNSLYSLPGNHTAVPLPCPHSGVLPGVGK